MSSTLQMHFVSIACRKIIWASKRGRVLPLNWPLSAFLRDGMLIVIDTLNACVFYGPKTNILSSKGDHRTFTSLIIFLIVQQIKTRVSLFFLLNNIYLIFDSSWKTGNHCMVPKYLCKKVLTSDHFCSLCSARDWE